MSPLRQSPLFMLRTKTRAAWRGTTTRSCGLFGEGTRASLETSSGQLWSFPKATPHSHTKGREGVCIACRSGLADLNACDDNGETALHLCVMYNNTEIAEVCSSYSQSPLICDTIAKPLRRLGYPPCHLSSTFAAPFAAP